MIVPLRQLPATYRFARAERNRSAREVGATLAEQLQGSELVVVWHEAGYDGAALARAARRAGLRNVLCVASQRHLGPAVRAAGTPIGVAVAVRCFPAVDRVRFSRAEAMLDALSHDLGEERARLDPATHAVLSFADAGTGGEELLVAALASAGPGLPLMGGTVDALVLDGERVAGGAVIALCASEAPVRPFLAYPYQLTEIRTVVTRCDAGRVVLELDGWSAVDRFAELAGLDLDRLRAEPQPSARALPAQLGWVVGGQVVLRPVRRIDGDALHLGAAVDEGTVLRLMRVAEDPAASIAGAIRRAIASHPVPTAAVWATVGDGLLAGAEGEMLEAGSVTFGLHVIGSLAQQLGPIHTCCALAGLVWGARG